MEDWHARQERLEKEKRLRRAAESGDVAVVWELLEAYRVDVNACDVDGWTALHYASWNEHAQVVELLLQANASVDAANQDGTTALLIASAQNLAQVVKLLLKANASVDAADQDGRTSLHCASLKGYTRVVELLLKANASVDAENEAGETSLLLASSEGHVQVVDLLLKANASVDAVDRDGWTPLHFASSENHTQIAELLLKANAFVDAVDQDGRTSLHWAALKGHADVVKLLLKFHPSVDFPNKEGRTSLHCASLKGYTQIVELLLEANARVDAVNEVGETSLLIASSEGHVQVVDLLLKANASVDAVDRIGETSLLIASSNGLTELVELLLNANASVDAVDQIGRSALYIAAFKGHTQVVELLLKANASVDTANERGRTPLHVACEWHHPDTVRLLLMSGANIHAESKDGHKPLHSLMNTHSYTCVDSKMLRTLQELVKCGAAWDTKCDEMVIMDEAWEEATALGLCMLLWAQELADGLPCSDIPIEVVRRNPQSTVAYIETLKTSREIVLRRKVCVVGPSCAGKTSFVKSITLQQPQLVHLDDRTIGIDHFSLRFQQYVASRDDTKTHEVTFWDFAGQDAYQVAHSLFFSPRTLFLVCIDLEAFTTAVLQASIMSNLKKQEEQLMDEFIERTVMKWIRLIVARQPDADFVFIASKEDLLKDNKATERMLKTTLMVKLKDVETKTQEMRSKRETKEPSAVKYFVATNVSAPTLVFVSSTTLDSVQRAAIVVQDLIIKSDRSFRMPDTYTQALEAIVAIRSEANSHDITTRIRHVFAKVDTLPAKLKLEPELCRLILQTLHDLGDVLWYEDLGVELFQDRVILDPLLLIDFIRQVINHNYSGQTMAHTDLKALPYWSGFTDKEQMKAMKQVLQKFRLVYSANEDRTMSWNSDLIVPAYWQTKTPAAWLFLGDILRINDTKSCEGEAVRVHWELHFEFGLPLSLFDHFVVESVSPFFTFDAGPDWIVYEEKEIAACRIMVGRDPKSLHRTMHVEAVVAEAADEDQAETLWASFQQLVEALFGVMVGYPGLVVSSFAWDRSKRKIGLDRLVESSANAPPRSVKWMPPTETWKQIKPIMLKQLKRDE